MPTYKNTITPAARFVVDGSPYEPGVTFTTMQWLDHVALGLTLISITPNFNPIIYSDYATGGVGVVVTVSIPTTVNGDPVTRFHLRLHCIAGSVTVQFNDVSFTPVLKLEPGDEVWSMRLPSRMIDKLILTCGAAGTNVKIEIERW